MMYYNKYLKYKNKYLKFKILGGSSKSNITKGILNFSDGAVYEGDIMDGKMHGYGTYKYNENVYTGEFVNNKMHGEGTYKHNGNVYTGGFLNSQMHGEGTYKHKNGNVYTGEFVNGEIKEGIAEYSSGNVFIGTFINAEMDYGTLTFKNNNIYIGKFFNDKLNGEGKLIYSSGGIYTGNFVNNKRHGPGQFQFSDNIKYIGTYVDGKLQGPGTIIYPDGIEYNSVFTDSAINITTKPTSLKHQKEYNIVLYICSHGCSVKDRPVQIKFKSFFKPTYVHSTNISCEYLSKPALDIAYVAGLFNDKEDIIEPIKHYLNNKRGKITYHEPRFEDIFYFYGNEAILNVYGGIYIVNNNFGLPNNINLFDYKNDDKINNDPYVIKISKLIVSKMLTQKVHGITYDKVLTLSSLLKSLQDSFEYLGETVNVVIINGACRVYCSESQIPPLADEPISAAAGNP